ncbi:Cytochrome P450 81D1 [Striga hermonthica]|uniref:(+)-piperitol/(+)-sesamin synthase n=1 Tax=Striga hermonthica TaxID=68872 RepID=A0A9N7NP74_STRHE|nr:Cytochrome P450 81D1 [Striga hermonthica]
MELTIFYTSLALFLIVLIIINNKYLSKVKKIHRLPPIPAPAIPVLGHLHLLKRPLHRTFHHFSQKHGPIFSLSLGSRRMVVVSSAAMAADCSSGANDIILCNRPHVLVGEHIGYRHSTVSDAPYGPRWRNLRRMASEEVLSPARLNAFSKIREDEIRRIAQTLIRRRDRRYAKVELRPIIFEFIFNSVTRMLAGKRYRNEKEKKEKESLGERFREMVSEVLEHAQSANPEDFIPFLRWIDYRGLEKKMATLAQKLDDFYTGLLEEHRRDNKSNASSVIGHLLSLQESDPEFYTDQIIKGFITNIMIAGTESSAGTIEWAMSLLLNHPQLLRKAQSELDSRVGPNRLLEEQDLPHLPYLANIVLETLRMFPAGPLMVPRESSADCKVGGFDVPRGSILMVNAWAIQRDPDVWAEPTRFKPERYDVDQVQKLIAFGMGRRACPGAGLAQRMVGLGLGVLVQCFDWERVGKEEVDLGEGGGLTMLKLEPLEAMCRPRDIMLKVLQQ